MTARTLHRVIGVTLLLPFFGWALTGLVFFLKPGYTEAYEVLALKTYPVEAPVTIAPDPAWLEIRYLRTVLGEHLLARTSAGWQHLNPSTRQPQGQPGEADVRRLLTDAFTANPSRYGNISSVAGGVVQTDTGVAVTLDWNNLRLSQRGKDTDRIDFLYKIHYLQWTGVKSVDKVLGLVGLGLVMVLSVLGVWLALRRG